jgi:hypothetical protein
MGASFGTLPFPFWEDTMTEHERDEIRRLRLAGNSYTQIGQILQLSRNTVKSVCQRCGFQPVCEANTSNDLEYCRNCGVPISQVAGLKHRSFCSEACRRAWWSTHRDAGNKKTAVQTKCTFCGRVFEDYARNHRKYCCHACYIRYRFYHVIESKGDFIQ